MRSQLEGPVVILHFEIATLLINLYVFVLKILNLGILLKATIFHYKFLYFDLSLQLSVFLKVLLGLKTVFVFFNYFVINNVFGVVILNGESLLVASVLTDVFVVEIGKCLVGISHYFIPQYF